MTTVDLIGKVLDWIHNKHIVIWKKKYIHFIIHLEGSLIQKRTTADTHLWFVFYQLLSIFTDQEHVQRLGRY